MRSFTSDDIAEFVFRNQYFSNYACRWVIEYLDDSDVWCTLKDATDFSFSTRNNNERSTEYQLTPTADTLSFKVNNAQQAYTLGAGGRYDGVLTKNRKCRLKLLWPLPEDISTAATCPDALDGEFYHAKMVLSEIRADIVSATVPPTIPLTLYDSTKYDRAKYTIAGYYLSKPITGFYRNFKHTKYTSITCTKTGSERVDLWYRLFSGKWSAWTKQTLSTGENTITVNTRADYIQTLVAFHEWSDAGVSALSVAYLQESEEFAYGSFYMNTPRFPNKEIDNSVSVQCYNLAKQILDKKITTKKYTGTTTLISTFITDVLLQAGLSASDFSIRTTTSTVRNPTLYTDTKLGDILEDCLNVLQLEDDYRFFVKNDVFTLDIKVTDLEADYVFDERFHLTDAERIEDAENQASYVTVYSDDVTLPDSGEPAGEVDLISAAVTGSTPGTVVISSFKTSPVDHFPAVNVRPVITTTGDFTVVEVERKMHTASPSITFTVTGTSGTYSIMLRGVVITASENVGFHSEHAGDGLNQRNGIGKVIKIVNPMISSDDAANLLAKFIFAYNSSAKTKVSAQGIIVPQVELNDNALLVCTRINEMSIFNLTAISFSGDATGVHVMNIEIEDTNQELTNFIYDRNGQVEGVNDLKYDSGIVYDQDILSAGEDTTTYVPPIIL